MAKILLGFKWAVFILSAISVVCLGTANLPFDMKSSAATLIAAAVLIASVRHSKPERIDRCLEILALAIACLAGWYLVASHEGVTLLVDVIRYAAIGIVFVSVPLRYIVSDNSHQQRNDNGCQ